MIANKPWQDPCDDILEFILRKISYFDLASFSAVCSSWHKAAKTYRRFSRSILLSISQKQTDNQLSFCIRTFAEGKVSRDATIVAVSLSERYRHFHCAGWSKEMLVLADMATRTEVVLIDRFYRQSFCLPPLDPPVFWKSIRRCREMEMEFFDVNIAKTAVLVPSDKTAGDELMNNTVLAVIFTSPRDCLACHMRGSWVLLDSNSGFSDIVARGRQLFALQYDFSVQIWNFKSDRPTMVMKFTPFERPPPLDAYSHIYLVGSIGEGFLLVRRHLSSKFRYYEYPVHTVGFQVFKSRLRRGEKWEEVDSLGDDVALFLGRNESVSVSIRDLPEGYQGNSIYFNHDFCVSFKYGSHEMGVYNLEHKKIDFFHALDDDLDGPTPVWMV